MPVPETKVESDLAREVIYQPESTQQQITKSKRGIYVRLGAFGNASNVAKAERSANMVAKAVIDTTDRNGKTLKIVKAGPFSTKAEANDAVIKLRTMGYQDAYISK